MTICAPVGERQHVVGEFDPERLRGLEVDHKLEFARLHDRQVGRFRAFENPAGINTTLTVALSEVGCAWAVAARSRQCPHGTAANWVRRYGEDDWNDRCRLLCREDCTSHRDNDIDLEPDELGCDIGEALAAPLRPAIFDHDRAALDPPEFAQPLHKGGGPW